MYDIWHDVEPQAQPTDDSCWATSFAMVISHARGEAWGPEQVAHQAGWSIYQCDNAGWQPVWDVAHTFSLNQSASACFTIDGWAQLLSIGPLWIAIADGSHAVVLVGMHGDGTQDGTQFFINDPWRGALTTTYHKLEKVFEDIDTVDGENLVIFHR